MIYPEDNRERNDTIIELRKQGWSYGKIAQACRLPRNAVAGVIYRSGVKPLKTAESKRLPHNNGYTIRRSA